jgi:aspartate carbamoyltransferase catalytic subunit
MMGLDVTLVGPPALIPPGIEEATGARVADDPEAMGEADVIYVLRMQHERMEPGQNFVPTLAEYARTWGVNSRRVRPGQVVMHPGPMNRGVEIAPDVADSAVSLVEDQVEAGLIVRMAVLYDLMTRPGMGTVTDIRERTGEWGAA